jgi:hypothetical protein
VEQWRVIFDNGHQFQDPTQEKLGIEVSIIVQEGLMLCCDDA